MATLTPGILLKLLQSLNSPTKPTGEHRSSLLQVTSILPATSSTSTTFWSPPPNYLLQLSDSKHSTFISLSTPHDSDFILTNRLQLGQFIYLDRLIINTNNDSFTPTPSSTPFSLPSPVNLRPLPGRHPFIGSPSPLAVKFNVHTHAFIVQPISDSDPDPLSSYINESHVPPMRSSREALRENDQNIFKEKEKEKEKEKKKTPQRFTSPGGKPRKERERDPSPVIGKGVTKRSASPVPSKCVVPSLEAAKEERERKGKGGGREKEGAIVVPSRYRQASPTVVERGGVGVRRAASPVVMRRMSLSPARRLSCGGSSGVGRKKVVGVVPKMMDVSGGKSGSGGRKSWDETPEKSSSAGGNGSGNGGGGGSRGGVKSSKPDLQALIRTQAALSRRLSDVHSHESKDDASIDGKSKTSSPAKSVVPEKLSALVAGITVHDKKWTDGSIPMDGVSGSLAKLGKEAIQRRAVAATAAAEALQEALATESIVRSLSMFSDLCSSSKAGNPLPTIDRFLSMYENALKAVAMVELVSSTHCSDSPVAATAPTEQSKSASAWVEAALSTDLAVVSLLTGQNVEPLSSLPKSSSKRQSIGNTTKNQMKPSSSPMSDVSSKGTWTRGHGMRDTLELAAKLKSEMEMWFLKFVEESLDAGFRVFSENGNNGGRKLPLESGSIAAILSQLKRINDWLDLVLKKDEKLTDKSERLKRKIYGFVIQHVGTTIDSATPVGSS